MIQHFMNAQRAMAQQAHQSRTPTKHGVITSYSPEKYAVQVQVMPDDVNTGWIPLLSPWVGNGWGLFCPPSIGDVVELVFQEADAGTPSAGWRLFTNDNQPLPCPSGEFWLVHQSGSLLKFHNDGSVELNAAGTLTSSAAQWNHTGPVHIAGNVIVQGGDVVADGKSLKTHKHGSVQSGGSQTGTPV